MWMMTKIGFFSIVEKPKGKIQVRSRCLQDLINFQLKVYGGNEEIATTEKADYRYRLVIPREKFQECFADFVKLVTYNNFKSEVGKTNKQREALYHQVWWILRQIEEEEFTTESFQED